MLSVADIEAFQRDGVICLRGLYDAATVAALRDALDDISARPSVTLGSRADPSSVTDAHTWLTDDRIRDFVLEGPTAQVVRAALESESLHFFYDQIFVRRAASAVPSPWHRDAPFWPLRGDRIASVWTSVDATTPESSALEFVVGSHRDDSEEIVPARVRGYALEPGDAVLFHARILHGARGCPVPTPRRAIATRWCGDGVSYWRTPRQMPIPWPHGLRNGESLSGLLFPRVVPERDALALGPRMRGPIAPDPEMLAAAARELASC